MPRSGKIEKRIIAPDAIYKNQIVAKLINKVMVDGKKSIAVKIVYGALDKIKESNEDPIAILEKAVENITPKMEVRPRRVGGASYMVPSEVRGVRRLSLSLSWLVAAARARSPKEVGIIKNQPVMIAKLAQEILDASAETGKAYSQKEEMHRMAEANKAFAHFRW